MKKIVVSFIIISILSGCTTNEDNKIDKANTEEKKVDRESENALNRAQSYIDTLSFSKKGLEKQLEFDKFAKKSIAYALNNVNVNYNYEALESAKTYYETLNMSKEALKDQLKFEKYTSKEIDYAVKNIDK